MESHCDYRVGGRVLRHIKLNWPTILEGVIAGVITSLTTLVIVWVAK
jgi:hypothetical protein